MFAAILPESEARRYWLLLGGTWAAVASAHVGLLTLTVGFEWEAWFGF